MSSRDVDDFLSECDDVLDDWHGSADSATWTADGSHEPGQIGGDYYGDDYMPGVGLFQVLPSRFSPYGGHFGPGGFVEGEPDWSEIGRPIPPGEPPYITRAWDCIRETLAPSVAWTLRQVRRDRYIAQLRHSTYATDIHGRPSRVRAVWDNPLSQEDA